MKDSVALDVMKQLIDQAIGAGLFKTADNVCIALDALGRLRLSIQAKDELLAKISKTPDPEPDKK